MEFHTQLVIMKECFQDNKLRPGVCSGLLMNYSLLGTEWHHSCILTVDLILGY